MTQEFETICKTHGRNCLTFALDSFGIPYGDAGIDAHINAWWDNKSWLIDKLSTHEKWNDRALGIATSINLVGGTGIPFVLSLNPADYLLMSNGDGWSGVHAVKPARMGEGHPCGQCCADTLSMLDDPSTAVLYSPVRTDDIPCCMRKKFSRQLIHVSRNLLLFAYGPMQHTSAEMNHPSRFLMQEILSGVGQFANLWKAPSAGAPLLDTLVRRHSHGVFHTEHRGLLGLSVAAPVYDNVLRTGTAASDPMSVIRIGSTPMCLTCGNHPVAGRDTLYCHEHSDSREVLHAET